MRFDTAHQRRFDFCIVSHPPAAAPLVHLSHFRPRLFTITESLIRPSQLKLELRAQLVELRRGLGVFGARCEPQLRGLHEHLTGFLQTTADKMAPVLA